MKEVIVEKKTMQAIQAKLDESAKSATEDNPIKVIIPPGRYIDEQVEEVEID